MKLKYTGLLLAVFSLVKIQAQVSSTEYNWDKPLYENVTVDDSTDIYMLTQKNIFTYYYADQDLREKFIVHRKMYLNSQDAIDENNKIYVSQNDEQQLLAFKARVINADGKIFELTKDDLLTGSDEETGEKYAYLALKGLEIGSQVEYYYIKDYDASYKGTYINLQGDSPERSVDVDIYSPSNLVFAAKLYNIDGEIKTDTTLADQNHIYVHIDSVKPIPDEPYSYTSAHTGRIIFKLDQNLYNGKKDLVSYSYTTQNIITALNNELSKKEEKALSKIEKEISKFKDDYDAPEVRKIEDFLKTDYNYVSDAPFDLSDISTIYEKKAFDMFGALKLYTHIFKDKNIPYQIVYTCDRSKLLFDADFQSGIFLNDLMLYLPDEDDYMAFDSPISRLGFVSSTDRGNKGLFMDEAKLDDNVVGISKVKYIKPKPASFNLDSLNIKVNFAPDLYDNSVDVTRVLSGYMAQLYQPVFDLIPEEKDRTKYEESVLKYIDSDAEVENLNIKNAKANLLGVKPLVVSGTLKNSHFLEKAGTNYLFKIGRLIGPQAEMYQEKDERQLPVENEFNHMYHRTITFTIPEGYTVSGLDDLNMSVKMMYQDTISSQFVSTYKQEGQKVTVNIFEYYNSIVYPKEKFNEYRNVINAAADFNKKTLLLKKA